MNRATSEGKRLEGLVDALKGELSVVKRERGESIMQGQEASMRLQGAEKELVSAKKAADRMNKDLMAARGELSTVSVRYEDSQLVTCSSQMKLQASQNIINELQEELHTKREALDEASRCIVMMKSENSVIGIGASNDPSMTGVGTSAVQQLRSDMTALRNKIADHEEEKRA